MNEIKDPKDSVPLEPDKTANDEKSKSDTSDDKKFWDELLMEQLETQ